MAKSGVRVTGDKELMAMLKSLPAKIAKKHLRRAVSKAAGPVLKLARQNAPRRSGLLKKSMSRKVKTYKSGLVAAIVGANKATEGQHQGRRAVPSNYAHLVEGGTAPHPIGKGSRSRDGVIARGGQHPGSKPTHFLRRAFDATETEALAIAAAELRQGLEAEAAKR